MPILGLQMRMRELGRIRIGQQEVSNGRRHPAKLETFRLTSPSHDLIDAAARKFGGHPSQWNEQWQVVTESDCMDVMVVLGVAITQWNELWSGGGCQRRCDGDRNVLTDTPCACPVDPQKRRELAAKGQACKPTTRLNVMLPDLPDAGVWRLETHGYYGATELAGAMQLARLSGQEVIRGRLRLEQREVKRPGEPPKRFAVPVLELPDLSMGDLLEGDVRQQIPARVDRRERVPRPALPPGPSPTTGRSVDSASGAREGGVKAASDGAVVTAGSDAIPPASGPAAPNESGDGDLLSVSGGARQQGGASSPDATHFCAIAPDPTHPLGMTVPCSRLPGHKGPHASTEGSWPQS